MKQHTAHQSATELTACTAIAIDLATFHGEWSYCIAPANTAPCAHPEVLRIKL
jgi:hypothetical protein